MKYEIIFWDWKEHVDIEHLNETLKTVWDGVHIPTINSIDTGQDASAVVVASEYITNETAQSLFDTRDDD